MFGFTLIGDREYQDLISDNQTLRDRVAYIESICDSRFNSANELSAANKSLESQLQSKTQDVTELGESIEGWEKLSKESRLTSQHWERRYAETAIYLDKLQAENKEYSERVLNITSECLSKSELLASLQDELAQIKSAHDRISTENQKHIAEKNQAEQLRNEATIKLGLTKAENQNYRLSVQVAVDNLAIAVSRIS